MKRQEERAPAFWAVIPSPVLRCKDLRPNAKLLYAEISSLAVSDGYCWATNEYLGALLDVAPRTVCDLIGQLSKLNFITVEVLRDQKTNEVTERRIWVNIRKNQEPTPPAKNGETSPHGNSGTPPAENGGTPPAKNGVENNNINLYNNPPMSPQGGAPSKGKAKKGPDWKPERFAAFWTFYSKNARGENEQGAIRAWDKLKPDDELIDTMARALLRQLETENWKKGIGIPYASTWLNNTRWKDILPEPTDGGEDDDEPEVYGWQ